MPRTPYRWAISGFSSVFTFASRNFPPNSAASFSRIGFSARHGPHQGAQKSTTTGVRFEASRTSRSKSAVLESKECAFTRRLWGRRGRSSMDRRCRTPPRERSIDQLTPPADHRQVDEAGALVLRRREVHDVAAEVVRAQGFQAAPDPVWEASLVRRTASTISRADM